MFAQYAMDPEKTLAVRVLKVSARNVEMAMIRQLLCSYVSHVLT